MVSLSVARGNSQQMVAVLFDKALLSRALEFLKPRLRCPDLPERAPGNTSA